MLPRCPSTPSYPNILSIAIDLNLSTRLGVDWVKPWNSVRIILGLGLRGPDVRPGLDNRHLIIEEHRSLRRS